LSLCIPSKLPSGAVLAETLNVVNVVNAPLKSPGLRSEPFGLPPKVSLSEYRNDPICKLSGLNYKVEAEVKLSADTWLQALAVVDTGAGPNLRACS